MFWQMSCFYSLEILVVQIEVEQNALKYSVVFW